MSKTGQTRENDFRTLTDAVNANNSKGAMREFAVNLRGKIAPLGLGGEMKIQVGDVILDKKHGSLAVLEESPSMFNLAPVAAPHKSFWLPKAKLDLKRDLKTDQKT